MIVVKVPTSQGGMGKRGSEQAPDAIEGCIKEIWTSESALKEPKAQFEAVEIVQGNMEETNANIFKKADGLFSKGIKPVFLGGDHSITYPLVKAFARHNKNAGLIVFDAHPDCTSDTMPPTHEDYIQALVNEGIVKPENIIILCVRNAAEEEMEYIREKRINIVHMRGVFGNVENACDRVMERAQGYGALYLSIDIDAVDPAFAPGTGYTEPGGITSREMIYFVQRLRKMKNLKAVDLVEVNPQKDTNKMTAKLAAKIIAELDF